MNPTTPKTEEKNDIAEAGNLFATTLAQLDKGNSLAELSAAIVKIVAAVRATGKKGTLKYTLTIQPVPNTDGAQVICVDKVDPDVPEPDRRATLFFTGEDGTLSRRDPNQRDWIADQEEMAKRAAAETPRKHDAISKEDLKTATASGR